jgi:glycosyltransferase involved in cell wall biosynthesis
MKQRPKCCIVFDYPHHYRSQFLEVLGHRVDLFVLFASGSGIERRGLAQYLPESLNYEVLSDKPFEKISGRLWPSLKLFYVACRRIYRAKPDILMIHGYYNPACWTGPLLKKWLGYRLIIWGESNQFDKHRYFALEFAKRLFLRYTEQCHVYGRNAKAYFESLGMAHDRVFITQPTVRESVFVENRKRARQQDAVPCRLIYVGRFEPEKNLFSFLQYLGSYFAVVRQSRLSLTLVGCGTQEQKLRDFVRSERLGDRIEFRGQLQQDQLASVLAEHDVLVLPSMHETYGLVVLEGMFVGLPVFVSTHCGCAADLLSDSTGWRMNPCDYESIIGGLTAIEECTPNEFAEKCTAAAALADSYSTTASVELTLSALSRRF